MPRRQSYFLYESRKVVATRKVQIRDCRGPKLQHEHSGAEFSRCDWTLPLVDSHYLSDKPIGGHGWSATTELDRSRARRLTCRCHWSYYHCLCLTDRGVLSSIYNKADTTNIHRERCQDIFCKKGTHEYLPNLKRDYQLVFCGEL